MNLKAAIEHLKIPRECKECGVKVSCYCKLRPLFHEDHGLVLVCKPCLKQIEQCPLP